MKRMFCHCSTLSSTLSPLYLSLSLSLVFILLTFFKTTSCIVEADKSAHIRQHVSRTRAEHKQCCQKVSSVLRDHLYIYMCIYMYACVCVYVECVTFVDVAFQFQTEPIDDERSMKSNWDLK